MLFVVPVAVAVVAAAAVVGDCVVVAVGVVAAVVVGVVAVGVCLLLFRLPILRVSYGSALRDFYIKEINRTSKQARFSYLGHHKKVADQVGKNSKTRQYNRKKKIREKTYRVSSESKRGSDNGGSFPASASERLNAILSL